MQMICDRLHGRISCEPLPCCNLYPCTAAVKLDDRLLTCYYFYYALYLWCDAWWRIVCEWLRHMVPLKLVITWGDLGMCLGVCGEGWVNRTGFYDESLDESCQGDATWAFPTRGTYGRYMCEEYILRRWLFEMEVPSRHRVLVIPFEKMSCLVPLRTLRAHQSILNGRGMDADQLGWCHYY